MGIEACFGYTSCKKLHCRQRCKGWFGAQPDILSACRGACNSGAYNLASADEFLCGGNWVNEAVMFGAYGYDPCPNSGATLEGYLDPLGNKEEEKARQSSLMPIAIGLGLLVVAAMFFFFRQLQRRKT